MPKFVNRLPVARLHRSSGRARVRIDGRVIYIGMFGSQEAKQNLDHLIMAWLANGRKLPDDFKISAGIKKEPVTQASVSKKEIIQEEPKSTKRVQKAPPDITIEELVGQFLEHADVYYRHADGEPTREANNFRDASTLLVEKFGKIPAKEFTPLQLDVLRRAWIKEDLTRQTVNNRVRRIRSVFEWAGELLIVPPTVAATLRLRPIPLGRGGLESGSRGSVPWELVEKTLPFLPQMIQAFVIVAYHSGCRVGELQRLTTGQIDRSGEVWVAQGFRHKTSYRGKKRKIFFGEKCQKALLPWLTPEDPDMPVFSPRKVDARQEKRKGDRLPGKLYSRNGLNQCLKRAIDRGNLPTWHLSQLRHSCAVRILDEFGIEAVKETLGHSSMAMSRWYARDSDHEAKAVAKAMG